MRFSKIALGVGIAAATLFTAAQAATFTIDYRHEYKSEYGENRDRICLIGAFENGVGFYVDSSFKSWGSDGPTDPNSGYSEGQWGNFSTNATEMSLWWGYKVPNTGFTITPGIITESTSITTGYKPYLRLQYNTDFGLWFAIRPRFDYWRYEGTNSNTPKADEKNGRIDAWIGYSKGNFGINYNYTYMWAINDNLDGSERQMFDKGKDNYEQNLAMNYRFGKWNPYIELGDEKVNSSTDDRQLRVRVGIQYTF